MPPFRYIFREMYIPKDRCCDLLSGPVYHGVQWNHEGDRQKAPVKSRQRVKGESPYIVMASDQL